MGVESAQTVLLGGVFLAILAVLIIVVYFGAQFSGVFDGLGQTLQTAVGRVATTFIGISNFVVQSVTQFSSYLISAFESFIVRVGNGFNSVYQFLTNQVLAIAESVGRAILTIASQVSRYIIEGFFSVLNSAALINAQMTQMATALITKLASLLSQGIALIFNLLSEAYTKGLGYISALVTGVVNAVGTGIEDAIKIVEIAITGAETQFNLLVSDFQTAYGFIETQITTVLNAIPNLLCILVIGMNTAIFALCRHLPTVNCNFCRNCSDFPDSSPAFVASCCNAGLANPPSCCTFGCCGT